MNDSVSDFGLGETIKGQNEDSVDINTALDGREYTFPVTAAVASAAGMHNRTVGRRVTARVLRNKTGGTLSAGEIVVVDLDGGHAGLGTADAKSSAGDRCCLVVDPALGSSTVAANDLFHAIVKGPTKVKQPATAESIAAGDVIKAGASGRLAEAALASDHGLVLGTALEANTTDDDLVEVELAPEWV
jgi:hypothetical protein